MDFRKATDDLLATVTLEDLADAMGVSVQAVRQARAAATSTSHRSPPANWERAVTRLAARRSVQLQRLASALGNLSKG